ncbi:hypothetical protein F5148DRAFT_95971 [Russula earlei]|uniref:Uncharacterized protein n=1 Tax=Russula earlei TaxID=71964 RepID=A0ACC0UK57_9AGAM|nr:hypothetical protein F5148DRAFT_95971 [Russula earlei]
MPDLQGCSHSTQHTSCPRSSWSSPRQPHSRLYLDGFAFPKGHIPAHKGECAALFLSYFASLSASPYRSRFLFGTRTSSNSLSPLRLTLPRRERNPGSDQLKGAQPSPSGLRGVERGSLRWRLGKAMGLGRLAVAAGLELVAAAAAAALNRKHSPHIM